MHRSPAADSEPDDRLALLRLLLADREWHCPPPARRQLAELLADPPVVRESTWQLLADELAAYLAFRKSGSAAPAGPGTGDRLDREACAEERRQRAA